MIDLPPRKAAETKEENGAPHNMWIYAQVQDTPKEAQKSFNNGRFSGTDINPMWRIKKLTEIFGPCGIGWWTQNVRYRFEKFELTGEIAVFCELELVVVDPYTESKSEPIYGVGGNMFATQRKAGMQLSDEAMKMAYTDALSIACKALGFSHDIYFQADKTKYTSEDVQPDFKLLTDRIQKGITLVTKDMSESDKSVFAEKVIAKHIGSVNYRACTDAAKLNSLLEELLNMAKKSA